MSSIEPEVPLPVVEKATTDRRRAFGFGLTIAVVLGAGGAYKLHRGGSETAAWSLISAAGAIFLYSVVHPAGALWLRGVWLRFGGLLGRINSALILSIAYLVFVTPFGFVLRVFGGRSFKKARSEPYIRPREGRDPKHFEHPY